MGPRPRCALASWRDVGNTRVTGERVVIPLGFLRWCPRSPCWREGTIPSRPAGRRSLPRCSLPPSAADVKRGVPAHTSALSTGPARRHAATDGVHRRRHARGGGGCFPATSSGLEKRAPLHRRRRVCGGARVGPARRSSFAPSRRARARARATAPLPGSPARPPPDRGRGRTPPPPRAHRPACGGGGRPRRARRRRGRRPAAGATAAGGRPARGGAPRARAPTPRVAVHQSGGRRAGASPPPPPRPPILPAPSPPPHP